MATMVVDPVFVDTNVLAFSTVSVAPLHAVALQRLQDLRLAGVELWISRQILREYLAALTRPQSYTAPLAAAALVSDIAVFQSTFRIAEDSPAVTTYLLNLLTSFAVGGKQVHDANIIATMQAYSLTRLLTHNTTDFARFSPIITLVPLV